MIGMNLHTFRALLSVLILANKLHFTNAAPRLYRAAVVEYHPVITDNEKVNLDDNLKNYLKFIEEAKKNRADIIVFPEGGLISKIASPIPHPTQKIAPCDEPSFETTQGVKKLSEAAKNHKIYVVVNLIEKRKCLEEIDNCSSSDTEEFNTNVVFDRNGVVVARYAKFNLYDEKVNQTRVPELVFFDTDFGVRFGTFTCFDILFPTPALELVEKYGIKDFVFPSFWFSELPYLTAVQVQKGWAQANNVNLLASGLNYPKLGSGGSGIYNGKFGEIMAVMPETITSKLLIANLPKPLRNNETQYELSSFKTKPVEISFNATINESDLLEETDTPASIYLEKDGSVINSTSRIIKEGKLFHRKLCHKKLLCCEFYVEMKVTTNTSRVFYRAVVYNGVREFGKSFKGGVQTCGIVACNNRSLSSCSGRVSKNLSSVVFNHISIEGKFKRNDTFQFPTTLSGTNLKTLQSYNCVFTKNVTRKNIEISLQSLWPMRDINTFSIWGRNFITETEEEIEDIDVSQ